MSGISHRVIHMIHVADRGIDEAGWRHASMSTHTYSYVAKSTHTYVAKSFSVQVCVTNTVTAATRTPVARGQWREHGGKQCSMS